MLTYMAIYVAMNIGTFAVLVAMRRQGRAVEEIEDALSAFGADGLEFTLGYWIGDPENGKLNLKSLINLAILEALRTHGVEIPFPQRVLHVRGPVAAPLAHE